MQFVPTGGEALIARIRETISKCGATGSGTATPEEVLNAAALIM